jgi:hypothetical protein
MKPTNDNLPPPATKEWRRSVIRVGGGRGFVLAHGQHRYVATAAHCLPFLPPAHGASHIEERTVSDLLSLLGEEPSIAAEIIFMDPIADIALLGTPDTQELWKLAEAYDELIEMAPPLPLATLSFERPQHLLPGGETFLGHPEAADKGWLLGLDGEWFACDLSVRRAIWIENAVKPIVGGMSGSPIITRNGAVGVCCLSCGGAEEHENEGGGPNPYLPFALPGWMVAT